MTTKPAAVHFEKTLALFIGSLILAKGEDSTKKRLDTSMLNVLNSLKEDETHLYKSVDDELDSSESGRRGASQGCKYVLASRDRN